MKRKAVLTLALAAVLVAMIAIPAFAATWSLPAKPVAVNNDNQKGWATEGFEDEDTPSSVAFDDFKKAKFLVLEVPAKPEGGGIQFVLQSPADWWQQTDLQVDDVYQDGVGLVFDFSKVKMNFAADDPRCKFLVCYYDGGWDAMGVTKAYLTDSLGGGGGGGGGGSAKTGDNTMIVLAIAAFALAACATVFVVRKVKA